MSLAAERHQLDVQRATPSAGTTNAADGDVQERVVNCGAGCDNHCRAFRSVLLAVKVSDLNEKMDALLASRTLSDEEGALAAISCIRCFWALICCPR